MARGLQHLKSKRRRSGGGPKKEAYKTLANMQDQGFPEPVAQAFLTTASTLQAAVLSRVPGPASTQLIDDGYTLKSFYIHAKSCNWGPMAGFVAQLPALNKKGISNIDYNLREHKASISKFTVLQAAAIYKYRKEKKIEIAQESDQTAEQKQQELDAALQEEALASSPFVPLGLSKKAFERLFQDKYVDPQYAQPPFDQVNNGTQSVVGIAFDKDKSVLMEYVLVRDPANQPAKGQPHRAPWYLYHGRIYVKREKTYELYLEVDIQKLTELNTTVPEEDMLLDYSQGEIHTLTNSERSSLSALWAKLKSSGVDFSPPTTSEWIDTYAVRVAQNPYPPHPVGDFRNAITGDYDLFAVWPLAATYRSDETIRLAEGRMEPPPKDLVKKELFDLVPGQNLTLALSYAPNVFIEVIPGYKEITPIEDPILGNINDAVFLTVGMLNSNVTQNYQRFGKAPNAAFHSDEGGRPGIYEIEFPVAAFLPNDPHALLQSKAGTGPKPQDRRALVLKNAKEFMDLIDSLRGAANIPLSYGWLMHLLLLTATNEQLQALCKKYPADDDQKEKKKKNKYFQARLKEHETLGETEWKALRAQVASMLTGFSPQEVLQKKEALAALDQAVTVFAELVESSPPAYDVMKSMHAITMEPAGT